MKAIVAEHTEEDREPTDTHSRSTLHPMTYYRTRENTQIGIDSTKALWSAISNTVQVLLLNLYTQQMSSQVF